MDRTLLSLLIPALLLWGGLLWGLRKGWFRRE